MRSIWNWCSKIIKPLVIRWLYTMSNCLFPKTKTAKHVRWYHPNMRTENRTTIQLRTQTYIHAQHIRCALLDRKTCDGVCAIRKYFNYFSCALLLKWNKRLITDAFLVGVAFNRHCSMPYSWVWTVWTVWIVCTVRYVSLGVRGQPYGCVYYRHHCIAATIHPLTL